MLKSALFQHWPTTIAGILAGACTAFGATEHLDQLTPRQLAAAFGAALFTAVLGALSKSATVAPAPADTQPPTSGK